MMHGQANIKSNQLPKTQMNQTNALDVVTGLLSGRSRARITEGARDVSLLHKSQDHRYGSPSLLHNGYRRSLPWVKRLRHELTAHRHSVQRLGMSGAIHLRPLWPSWCGQREFYLYLITENTSQTSNKCS